MDKNTDEPQKLSKIKETEDVCDNAKTCLMRERVNVLYRWTSMQTKVSSYQLSYIEVYTTPYGKLTATSPIKHLIQDSAGITAFVKTRISCCGSWKVLLHVCI